MGTSESKRLVSRTKSSQRFDEKSCDRAKTWDVIVICGNKDVDIHGEVVFERQRKNYIANGTRILLAGLEENEEFGFSIADGLLVAAEYLDVENLSNARVLVITVDKTPHFFSACMSYLPVMEHDSCVTFLDFILESLDLGRIGVPTAGVWICSSNALLVDLPKLDSSLKKHGVNLFLMEQGISGQKTSQNYYQTLYDPISKMVEGFVPPCSEIAVPSESKDDDDSLVIGMIHLNVDVCEVLLDLLYREAFHPCSNIGMDSGSSYIHLSLFDDILEVLCGNCTLEAYGSSTTDDDSDKGSKDGVTRSVLPGEMREALFEALNGKFTMQVVEARSSSDKKKRSQYYSPLTAMEYHDLIINTPERLDDAYYELGFDNNTNNSGIPLQLPASSSLSGSMSMVEQDRASRYSSHAGSLDSVSSESSRTRTRTRSVFDQQRVDVGLNSHVIGSLLLGQGQVEENSVLENCKMTGKWKVHEHSLCIGLRSRNVTVPPGIILQERLLRSGHNVVLLYKLTDDLDAPVSTGTFMGLTWKQFLQMVPIDPIELWPSDVQPCLRTARLFPYLADSNHGLEQAQFYLLHVLGQLHLEGNFFVHVPPGLNYITRKAYLNSHRLSIADIEEMSSLRFELNDRASLTFRIDEFKLAGWLLDGTEMPKASESIFQRMAENGYWSVFRTLDQIAINAKVSTAVCARTLQATALGLITFATSLDPSSKFKEGPAHNNDFAQAFHFAHCAQGAQCASSLANTRTAWLRRNQKTETLFRIARHYLEVADILNKSTLLEN